MIETYEIGAIHDDHKCSQEGHNIITRKLSTSPTKHWSKESIEDIPMIDGQNNRESRTQDMQTEYPHGFFLREERCDIICNSGQKKRAHDPEP